MKPHLHIILLLLLLACSCSCSKKPKQYKDVSKLAAEIKARKAAEKAKAQPKPEPYVKRDIKEAPAGTIFFARRAGSVTWTSSLTLP